MLSGNSSISPYAASSSPWMRTMPSVTETTVPTLRASVADWKFLMRSLIRSLISDALMDMSKNPLVRDDAGESLQASEQ